MKTRVKELRTKHKMSQEELANALGVTRQTIMSIENEKYVASLPLAYKIASYFELSIEEVFILSEIKEEI
ncbi:MAG: helix-turn-helix transcriptional regulator [Clostridiaceae bacterium]